MSRRHSVIANLITIILAVQIYSLSHVAFALGPQKDCDTTATNDLGKCCTNYHRVNNTCQECFPGYFGDECTSKCIYPYFGYKCQEECICSESDCNFQNGCPKATTERQSSSTNFDFSKEYVSKTFITETITVLHQDTEKANDSMSVSFILIVCVGSLISVVVLIGIIKTIVVFLYVTETKNNTDTSSDVYLDIDENLQVETRAESETLPREHVTVRVTEYVSSFHKCIDLVEENGEENMKERVCKKESKTKHSPTNSSDKNDTRSKRKQVNSCELPENFNDDLEQGCFKGKNNIKSPQGIVFTEKNDIEDNTGIIKFEQGAETDICVDSYIFLNKQTEITHL